MLDGIRIHPDERGSLRRGIATAANIRQDAQHIIGKQAACLVLCMLIATDSRSTGQICLLLFNFS